VTLIDAKFSKDLFTIFKVIGLQTKWKATIRYDTIGEFNVDSKAE